MYLTETSILTLGSLSMELCFMYKMMTYNLVKYIPFAFFLGTAELCARRTFFHIVVQNVKL